MTMKRMVDYPRLYDSAKLAALPSDELRSEYVWLLGIAGPNGSFEWSERRLWAAAYAPVRDKTAADLSRYLDAFLKAGLLVKWEQDGKGWGYFVGSDVPGRLPRDSWKKKFGKSRQLEPAPPAELLQQQRARTAHGKRALVTPEACQERETGVPLLESLSLSEIESEDERNPSAHPSDERVSVSRAPSFPGYVKTLKTEPLQPTAEKAKRLETTKLSVLALEAYNAYPRKVGKADALKAFSRAISDIAKRGPQDNHPDCTGNLEQAKEWLVGRIKAYASSTQVTQQPDRGLIPYPGSWARSGRYDDDPAEWSRGQRPINAVPARSAIERHREHLAQEVAQ